MSLKSVLWKTDQSGASILTTDQSAASILTTDQSGASSLKSDQSGASILTTDQSQVLRLEPGGHMMGPGPGVMEPDENFCLRWNDYEKKYAETFRTLREDDHFAGALIA